MTRNRHVVVCGSIARAPNLMGRGERLLRAQRVMGLIRMVEDLNDLTFHRAAEKQWVQVQRHRRRCGAAACDRLAGAIVDR